MNNKIKQAEASKRHYEANKKKHMQFAKINTAKYSQRNREYINEYLLKHPCVDCGNSNPLVLEFDHITNDKRCNISKLVHKGASIKSIENEISKCEVRCANCHRIITSNRRNSI